jgi:nucleotide-binding universal stress UspA family protein
MYKTILVATDASEFSDAAIEAAKLANELGSKLAFFYTTPLCQLPPFAEGLLAPGQTDKAGIAMKEMEPDAERTPASVARNMNFAEVTVEQQSTVSNSPYKAIIEAAKQSQCELIIMASHGLRGLAGVLHGIETQTGLTYSATPVLVDSINANQRQIPFSRNIHQR